MLTDISANLISLRLRCVLLAALVGLVAVGPSMAAAREQTDNVRVRVAWGGATATQWSGNASVAGGRLRELALLGREADTPGSLWLEEGRVAISEPRARNFDGFDITVEGDAASTLQLEMKPTGAETATTVEVPLSRLLAEAHRSTLSSPNGDTTLLVRRVSEDALRIHLDGTSRIYRPGETLRMSVSPHLAGLTPGGTFDLETSLARERQTKTDWRNSQRVAISTEGTASAAVEIPLPDRQGVYTVRLAARTPPGNRVRFWEAGTGGVALAERSFQVVVLAEDYQACYLDASWHTLLTIDPANPSWWDRMPEWTRIDRLANLSAGPIGSEPHRTTTVAGRTLAELTPSDVGRPTWQAFPLPAARPGEPHVVEVEVPSGRGQQLALRIYEADAGGKLIPNGPGGGVEVDPYDTRPAGQVTTYRYLFWPRTNSPVVVVQNVSTKTPAAFGKISLRGARPSLAKPAKFAEEQRMMAAMFDWRTLLERTSSGNMLADGRPAVDDCLTFYNMAVRTAALLELSGYNTAVVNVLDEGSAAFALPGGQSLPVLDTSRIANAAVDLPALDATELMLRVFSRRGLRLVPTLRFNATLPGIDEKLRRKEYATLEEFPIWTDLAGRPRWSTTPYAPRSSTPHYLATHPDVAAELRRTVERLIAIAGPYEAFAGVALDFSADSYLALPPAEYGVTAGRLAELARSMDADEATLMGWRRDPKVVFDDAELRRRWLSMRAQATTNWLARIAGDLDANDDSKLLLLCPELLANREFAPRPRGMDGTSLSDLYLERGLDLANLAEVPRLEAVGTWHDTTGLPLVDAAVALSLNARRQRESDERLGGELVWQHTYPLDLPVGETLAHGGVMRSAACIETSLDYGSAALTLASFESGATAPLLVGSPAGPPSLGSQRQKALLRVLAQLPVGEPRANEEIVEQPVAARLYAGEQGATAVVINDSPWPATATVTLEVTERCSGQAIGTQDTTPASPTGYAAGQHSWTVSLEAYDVRLLRFDRPGVHFLGMRVQVPEGAETLLAAACDKLERRDLKPDSLPPYTGVRNPSFEETDAEGIAIGWQAPSGVMTGTPSSHGVRAGLLASRGGTSSIATETFGTPPTGEIAVTVDVNVVEISDDSTLRIVVEEVGVNASQRFIERTAAELKHNQATSAWNTYQFGVEDLPFDSTSKMRIRFELVGTGEIRIDNLRTHELVYPLLKYQDADQQVLALVQHSRRVRQAFDTREFRTCQMLLDGYWSRFVMEYLPEIKPPAAEKQTPVAAGSGEAGEPATPKLSDRMRGWFRF